MIFPRCSHDIPNKYTTMVFPICSRIGHILCLEIWQHQKPSLFQKSASVSQVVDQRLAADQESRLCHRLCTRLSTMKKWGGLLITNHVPLWHGPLSANYECNWSGIGMRFCQWHIVCFLHREGTTFLLARIQPPPSATVTFPLPIASQRVFQATTLVWLTPAKEMNVECTAFLAGTQGHKRARRTCLANKPTDIFFGPLTSEPAHLNEETRRQYGPYRKQRERRRKYHSKCDQEWWQPPWCIKAFGQRNSDACAHRSFYTEVFHRSFHTLYIEKLLHNARSHRSFYTEKLLHPY